MMKGTIRQLMRRNVRLPISVSTWDPPVLICTGTPALLAARSLHRAAQRTARWNPVTPPRGVR